MRGLCFGAAAAAGLAAWRWHRRQLDRALAAERLGRVLDRARQRCVRAALNEALVLGEATNVINRAQAREKGP